MISDFFFNILVNIYKKTSELLILLIKLFNSLIKFALFLSNITNNSEIKSPISTFNFLSFSFIQIFFNLSKHI